MAPHGDAQHSLKVFRQGTDRVIAPEQTLARLTPLLSGFGITRVADVTGMDCIGIPTVMVVRPNSRSVSVSQGKGVTLVNAKVSGVMESLEQFHAERVNAPLQLGSLDEVAEIGPVADVAQLPTFVKEYERSQRLLWIAGFDVATRAQVFVPFEVVHLDLRLPLPAGSGYFMNGSNGLASGNTATEALCHGLCELIERDALSLFLQADRRCQDTLRLDLTSVDDQACLSLLDKYARAGIQVAVWDITSDVQVPSFLCWIVEAKADAFRPVGLAQGSGCHPKRAIALSRALTEAAQSRVTRIVGSRDDVHPRHISDLRSPDAVEMHQAQTRWPGGTGRSFTAAPNYDFERLDQDVTLLLDRLAAAGIRQVIGVDLSKPGYPFSVVRVVAPGLEGAPYLPGYKPGRRARRARAGQLETDT